VAAELFAFFENANREFFAALFCQFQQAVRKR
jgi:hypothetical protein